MFEQFFGAFGLKTQKASNYEIQWSSIIPETMGELYYNGICLP